VIPTDKKDNRYPVRFGEDDSDIMGKLGAQLAATD